MKVLKAIKMSNVDVNILSEFLVKAKRSTFAEGGLIGIAILEKFTI